MKMARKVTSTKSSFSFEQKDLFKMDNNKKKNTKVQHTKNKFSLLDDFDTGNTTLDDIFENDSHKQTKTNKVNELKPEDKFNILDEDFLFGSSNDGFDFEKYIGIGLSQIKTPSSTDLDFSKVEKTIIDEEEALEGSYKFNDDITGKNGLHGLLGNLSLDELDIQVRSNHYDPFSDHHAVDINIEPELKNFLASSPEESNIMLDEIFDQPEEFNNLEFDNIEDEFSEDEEPIDTKIEDVIQSHPQQQQQQQQRQHHQQNIPHNRNKRYDFHLHEEPISPNIFSDHHYYRDSMDFGYPTKSIASHRQQQHTSPKLAKSVQSPRRICSPSTSKGKIPEKSNIRIRKNLLNLIVESSDGSLDDATRYATEINSQNCEGIPIPEKTTELVTIPTAGPSIGGIKRAAIVRAMVAKTAYIKKSSILKSSHTNSSNTSPTNNNNASTNNKKVGFYSESEQNDFLKRDQKSNHFDEVEDKENKRLKNDKKDSVKIKTSPISLGHSSRSSRFGGLIHSSKRVSWAESLEW